MTKTKKYFIITIALWVVFMLFTVLVQLVDVQAIGPQNSTVGFAGINRWMQNTLGSHPFLYDLTEWLGIVAAVVAIGIAGWAMAQAICRKSVKKIDQSLLYLLVCYLIMGVFYILFEETIVNYRPILEEGVLEASYPSSHTMLVFFIMGTALVQWNEKIVARGLKFAGNILGIAVIAATVIGRLLSGVHWFTDILGGVLLASALVAFYYSLHLWSKKEEV